MEERSSVETEDTNRASKQAASGSSSVGRKEKVCPTLGDSVWSMDARTAAVSLVAAEQMNRESSFRIGVEAMDSTQQKENLSWEKGNDEDDTGRDSETSASKPKRKTVSFCRIIAYRDSLDTLLMIIGTLGAIGAGCSQPLLTVLFGDLVDVLNSNSNFSASHIMDKISKVCLKLLYAAFGAGAASILEMAGWTISAERQSARIRSMYLKALLRQNVGYFDEEVGVGESMNKISADILLIQDALGDKVANVIELSTRFFFGWGVGFYMNWKMTAVTIAAIPPVAVIGLLMAIALTRATTQAHDAYTEAGGIVDQVLGSLRTVASNTGEERAVKKYDGALGKAEKAGLRLAYTTGFGLGVLLFVTYSTYGLAMWYGSRLVADGEASTGKIINVIFTVVMGGSALGVVAPHLTGIFAGLGAAYSMFQVIERKPPIDSNDLSGRILPSVKGEIHLRNISFAYPTRPEFPVFTNFDLLIQAGSTTALVGESGSGKSSVIQLIERFYDPQSGQVLLDGVDIRELQLRWLRSQIALVSQEPVLFATSIIDNIKYGKDDATEEEIKAACVFANAALFIDRMPQGYKTLVGERGTQLSGGQKQRLAIARAILKNPRILLLDEATSALDAESEHMVQDALDRMRADRTTVVVAHRLSTIKNADLIAVVQKGVIVETGVHEELTQRADSAYSQLIRLQETRQADEALGERELESNSEQIGVTSGRLVRPNNEGSFGKHSSRDLSSRRLARRGSSSRLSFVSDLLSGSQPSSKHFDPVEVDDLLENEPGLEKEEKSEEKLIKQKVAFSRLVKMNKPELPFFFFGAVGSAFVGAILPLFAFLLYKTITALLQGSPQSVRKDGGFYASLFVVVGGLHLLFTPCDRIGFGYVGERFLRRLRLKSFQMILRQEAAWFDDESNSSAKLGSRLLLDAAAVRSVTGETLSLTVQAISSAIAGLAFAFSGSWELTLIVLAISPFLSLQGILYTNLAQSLEKKDKDSLSQSNQVANDAVSNIRTVASFCAEEKMVELYASKSTRAYSANVKNGILNGMVLGFANFSLFAGYALSFYSGAKLVEKGKLKPEAVFLVFLSVALSTLSISAALRKGPDLGRCKPAIRSIFELLDRVSKIDPMDERGESLQNLKGRIEFKAVSFKYPTRPTVPVLKRLSFKLKAGKTLALVGGSGSGKSTVISLIERFYDPDSGSILIDEVEIQELNLKWLRQNIGLVSQEPVLFDDSIRGNILYGKEGTVTEDEIHEAARTANAHAFISALPDGYATRVGERGVQLSGGQKQRVAIARAILKSPKILLLDEATSALDAESEHIVQEALDQIMVQRSTVIVAHRLSTVRNCNQILVLQNGSIAEKGTYDDLLATGGIFASLVRQTFYKAK